MLDLYEAVKNCKLGAFLRTFENRIIITTLIFFKNYDESVALYIEPTDEENTYIISDCHSVTDYWETMYINPGVLIPKYMLLMNKIYIVQFGALLKNYFYSQILSY